MKVSLVRRDPAVTVRLSYREAIILKALVGGVHWRSPLNEAAQLVVNLFQELADAGVTSNETFSDFFEGEVSA